MSQYVIGFLYNINYNILRNMTPVVAHWLAWYTLANLGSVTAVSLVSHCWHQEGHAAKIAAVQQKAPLYMWARLSLH